LRGESESKELTEGTLPLAGGALIPGLKKSHFGKKEKNARSIKPGKKGNAPLLSGREGGLPKQRGLYVMGSGGGVKQGKGFHASP